MNDECPINRASGICYFFDAGWCYKPDTIYNAGCIGSVDCKYCKECK